MKILWLGPPRHEIFQMLAGQGDEVIQTEEKLSLAWVSQLQVDWIVSYGYRHLVQKDMIEKWRGKILNLHISYLPWNRGADPNLWSFLEDTPKGVSIHVMDEGLDTGPLLLQRKVEFDDSDTLRTSYEKLSREIERLFCENWHRIKAIAVQPVPQPPGGSFHRSKDKEKYMHLLQNGWDTPITCVVGKGQSKNGDELC